MEVEFDVEVVDISELKDHPRNYQEHPQDQIDHIKRSILENGVYKNVVIARDGTILAGHGVVKAARQLGVERFPVRRLNLAPDDVRALKVMAADNEVSHLAMKDDRVLTELLKEIGDADDLLGTGFDEMMLAGLVMVTRDASEIADFDAAAHWVGVPEYDPGDPLYRLSLSFRSEDDREECLERLGLEGRKLEARGKGNLSSWWPPAVREDIMSVKWEPREDDEDG